MADLYNIPQDDGLKWRKSQFLKLLKAPYIDGATECYHLSCYAEEHELNNEQRFWLAYLYALSYSSFTALRTFDEFPHFKAIKLTDIERYWEQYKNTLWFNPDRKYVKNNDKFVDCIKSFRKNMTSSPYEKFMSDMGGNLDQLYSSICKDWEYFGPHSAFLMLDALYELFPESGIDVSKMDWKHRGKPVVEGMAHFMYEDELIQSGKYDFEKYDKFLEKIKEKSGRPIIQIESTLCAFRKLFKGSRYIGYYADRNLEECRFAEKQGWAEKLGLFRYRALRVPKHLRGEVWGWSGIRKEKCKKFLQTGDIS